MVGGLALVVRPELCGAGRGGDGAGAVAGAGGPRRRGQAAAGRNGGLDLALPGRAGGPFARAGRRGAGRAGRGRGAAGAAGHPAAGAGGIGMSFTDMARRLAGQAGLLLGWRPEEFWRATPDELETAFAAFAPLMADATPPDRAAIARLRRCTPMDDDIWTAAVPITVPVDVSALRPGRGGDARAAGRPAGERRRPGGKGDRGGAAARGAHRQAGLRGAGQGRDVDPVADRPVGRARWTA